MDKVIKNNRSLELAAIDNNQDLVTISSIIRKLLELKSNNCLNGCEVLSPADTEILQIVNKSLTYQATVI